MSQNIKKPNKTGRALNPANPVGLKNIAVKYDIYLKIIFCVLTPFASVILR